IFCLLSCAAIVAAASNAPSLTASPSTPSTSIKSAYNAADHPRDPPVRSTPHTTRSAFRLSRTVWPRMHLNRTLRRSVNLVHSPLRRVSCGRSIRSSNSSFERSRRVMHARVEQPISSRPTTVKLKLSNVAPTATPPSSTSSNSSFERSRRVMQARVKQPITSDPTTIRLRPNNVAPTATRSPSQLPVIPSDLGPEIISYCGQGVCAKNPKWCGVMNNPIRIYLVWYGSFSDTQNLLRTFIHSFSSTEGTVADWWRTNTLYYDCSGRYVSSSVILAKEHHVRRPLRLLFGLNSIRRVVNKRVKGGSFPLDEDGVYFVIGDGSVAQRDNQGGMCSAYCGWHDFVRIRKKLIKVAYVGSPVKVVGISWFEKAAVWAQGDLLGDKEEGEGWHFENSQKVGMFPFDEDGVYFVIGDGSVAQVPWCNAPAAAGWLPLHSTAAPTGISRLTRSHPPSCTIIPSLPPNPPFHSPPYPSRQCPSSCWMAAFAFNGSPNGDRSFDSLLSTFAHELAEATSDPYVTNWYDAAGQENADICAWK
ncbi:unnamed protein product, partial [Closterium sp. Naga37s-1]